jgi:hypothetical protein
MMTYFVINTDHMKNSGGLQSGRLKASPSLGQTTLQKPSSDLTEEQIYKLAGQTIVVSGEKLAAKMSSTYEKYQGVQSYLPEAAAAFVAGGPIGPFYTAADLWWQGSRNKEAVVALQASETLGTQWMNEMTQADTGWLPLYLDGIEKVDPVLAKQVSATFDKVNAQFTKTAKLLQGVNELPPQVVNQFINSLWSTTKSDLAGAYKTLSDLAEILHNLLAAAGQFTGWAKKFSEAAPAAALAVIVGGIAFFSLHS